MSITVNGINWIAKCHDCAIADRSANPDGSETKTRVRTLDECLTFCDNQGQKNCEWIPYNQYSYHNCWAKTYSLATAKQSGTYQTDGDEGWVFY